MKKITPMFYERLARLENDPDSKIPEDQFQLIVKHARDTYPRELNPKWIMGRLLFANLGSMHQTSMAASNLILDLICSNEKYNTINQVRQEISQVLQEQNGEWNKATVNKMVKTDSILRETMRLHAFPARNVVRKVVKRDGVITPDGVLIPYGTIISVAAYTAQTDPDNMGDDAKEFDPFRFSRVRESPTSSGNNLSFVSLSSSYTPFGGGKHACPGRPIVEFELKQFVSNLVQSYDMELAPEHKGIRPVSPWICEAQFPPTGARIRVRRREKA